MSASDAIARDRIAVVETVYHQAAGEQPTSVESRFQRWLEGNEQPCVRRCHDRENVATEDWKPLDAGWIRQAGMIVLTNDEGRFSQTIPTSQEHDEAIARVIEVGCYPVGEWDMSPETSIVLLACWLVLPGESLRAQPVNLKSLRVRCRKGTAKFTLCVFPA